MLIDKKEIKMLLKKNNGKFEIYDYSVLEEKLIEIKPKFNQVVLLAGGGGSGKGFATSKFTNIPDTFKRFDVDALKDATLNIQRKIDKFSPTKFPKLAELLNKNPEIKKIATSKTALKTPENVFKLHSFIKSNLQKKWIDNRLVSMIASADPRRKPNILFDKTGRSLKEIEKVLGMAVSLGYEPEDITIIWVFTDFRISLQRNKTRDRIVPDDVIFDAHESVAMTMFDIIKGTNGISKSLYNGEFYIINSNNNMSIQYPEIEDSKLPKNWDSMSSKEKRKWSIENTDKFSEKTKTIGNFNYIKLKERGKKVDFKAGVEKKIVSWIVNNAPRTKVTAPIFDYIERNYPELLK